MVKRHSMTTEIEAAEGWSRMEWEDRGSRSGGVSPRREDTKKNGTQGLSDAFDHMENSIRELSQITWSL